ncbi:MAG: hypothetical protein ACRC5R_02040 [Mycoplasmatales bacterium]
MNKKNEKFIWDDFEENEDDNKKENLKKEKESLYKKFYGFKESDDFTEVNPEIKKRIEKKKHTKIEEKKIKKNTPWRIKLLIILIVMIIISLFFVPIINIESIDMGETNFTTKDQLLAEIQIKEQSRTSVFRLLKLNFLFKNDLISGLHTNYVLSSRVLNIKLNEIKPILLNSNGRLYYEYNGNLETSDTMSFDVPKIQGFIPETELILVKSMQKLDYNIIKEIATIALQKSDISEELVLMEMKDGNYIKIMMSQIGLKLQYYNQMSQIINATKQGQDGIIHLDRGDFYEPI